MATLGIVKQLLYRHTLVKPLAVVLARWITQILAKRLTGVISRLVPGPRGRNALRIGLWGVSLVVQIVCLVVLSELISLCIDLAELWTVLAHKHLEITLDKTS